MARGKYEEWLEPNNLLLIRGWKRNGLTNDEIASNIGISRKTLQEWASRFSDIRDALKIGKEQANFLIENKLFSKAMNGNTTAMIFWLKNNWREKYNDSQLTQEQRVMVQEQIRALQLENKRRELDLEQSSNPFERIESRKFDDIISQLGGDGLDE